MSPKVINGGGSGIEIFWVKFFKKFDKQGTFIPITDLCNIPSKSKLRKSQETRHSQLSQQKELCSCDQTAFSKIKNCKSESDYQEWHYDNRNRDNNKTNACIQVSSYSAFLQMGTLSVITPIAWVLI